jgi:hypothetical protein
MSTEPVSAGPLRLKAEDEEDLAVIAACLQDALVAVGDMAYRAEEQEFVLVANRFKWESPPVDARRFARVLTGITIEGVTAVKRRRIDLQSADAILSLLTVVKTEDAIHLAFAGGAAIRLEAGEIRLKLQDFGEEWPALWRPRHGT